MKTSTSDKSPGPKSGKKSESGDEGAGKEKGRDKSDFGPEPKALKGEAVGRCLDAAVEAYGGFDPMRESEGLGEVLDHAIFAALGREVPARKKEEAVRRLRLSRTGLPAVTARVDGDAQGQPASPPACQCRRAAPRH